MAREIFYFKNHAENEAGRLVPDLWGFFSKSIIYIRKKTSGKQLGLTILR